ncbi:hypothetical protein EVAR_7957_1 [Eumeta japonica]|uniref:Uncharacterized protein n=1 Tax=Eumeta variegata TaxID=151549 RepID=A0A4C1TJF6_EUMVA|nr:hypothetical protein EVAR_7957_1 [Eumeta japonica]
MTYVFGVRIWVLLVWNLERGRDRNHVWEGTMARYRRSSLCVRADIAVVEICIFLTEPEPRPERELESEAELRLEPRKETTSDHGSCPDLAIDSDPAYKTRSQCRAGTRSESPTRSRFVFRSRFQFP